MHRHGKITIKKNQKTSDKLVEKFYNMTKKKNPKILNLENILKK